MPPSSDTTGSENIVALSCDVCEGFSSMMRDFSNRKHNELISMVEIEEEAGATGKRNHSTGGNLDGGRCGGGYVVGKAWEGAKPPERGDGATVLMTP